MRNSKPIPPQFSPPRLTEILPRPSLHRFWEERTGRRLTIITGRAGQGKSVLAADYLIRGNHAFYWLNLDTRTTQRNGFYNSLKEVFIFSLEDSEKWISEKYANSAVPADKSAEDILGLISEIRKEAYIVIDNFQFLNQASDGLTAFCELLERIPKNIKFIIISREQPFLNLVKLRSDKELLELTDRELSFSFNEITMLFRDIYNISLEEDLIHQIYYIFRGWITGYIYLIEKLVRETPENRKKIIDPLIERKRLQEVDDFFYKEVFDGLRDDLKDNLIRFAPLDYFDSGLAEVLTGQEGETFIQQLEKMNLFLETLELKEQQFMFTPVFSQFLNSLFTKLKDKEKHKLFLSIGDYWSGLGNNNRAVEFFIKAEDYNKAKDTFFLSAEKALAANNFKEIGETITLFPENLIESDPLLSYYQAFSTNLKKPFTARKKLISLIDYFHKTKDYNREAAIYTMLLSNYFFYQTSTVLVQELLKMVMGFLNSFGNLLDPPKKEILLSLIPLAKWWLGPVKDEAFEAVLRAEETSFRLHNEEAYLTARLVLARIYLEKGAFTEAEKLLKETEKMFAQENKHHPYTALLRFYLGDSYFYLGRISLAIEQVEKGLFYSSEDLDFRLYLELNLVLYHLYLDRTETSEYLFDSFRQVEIYENLYIKYYLLYFLQMLIAYRSGNTIRAEYFFKRLMEKENEQLLRSDFPYSFIALSEVALFLNKTAKSREILNALLKDISPETHPYSSATVYALLGYISKQEGFIKDGDLWFSRMEEILDEKGYTNLDICDPSLLYKLAKVSGAKHFQIFPRIHSCSVYMDKGTHSKELEIKTLGGFSVYVKGKEVPNSLLTSQKRVMDLLKLLIVYRKNGVMKEKIYELFWPRYSYKSARDNLNTIIYRLRKILGEGEDYFITDTNSIRFKEGVYITDVDTFNEYSQRAREEENQNNTPGALEFYKLAAHVYKGDFLDTDLYYDFIRDERESLRNNYRLVLFKLTKMYLLTEDYLKATEWGNKVIQIDPLCEPAYRLVMISCALMGNRSEIPRIFERLNQKLRESYNVAADQKTAALKDRLLSGEKPNSSLAQNETIF